MPTPTPTRKPGDLLNSGGSRADVAVGISESSEHQTDTQAAFGPGVFVPNANASAIARLYLGLLDRPAEGNGLVDWNTVLQNGSSFHQVADGFINSDEFQSAHAGINNHDFVDLLYQNALGRDVDDDPSGQTWINLLNQGSSRADVALGIAESPEATFHHLHVIEDGFLLA